MPGTSRVNQNRINAGVWKAADGKVKESTTGTSSSTKDNGTVYGNGSKSPVLGYVIRNGYIETAQNK